MLTYHSIMAVTTTQLGGGRGTHQNVLCRLDVSSLPSRHCSLLMTLADALVSTANFNCTIAVLFYENHQYRTCWSVCVTVILLREAMQAQYWSEYCLWRTRMHFDKMTEPSWFGVVWKVNFSSFFSQKDRQTTYYDNTIRVYCDKRTETTPCPEKRGQ